MLPASERDGSWRATVDRPNQAEAQIITPTLAASATVASPAENEESSNDSSAVYSLASEPPSECVPSVPLVADFGFIHLPLYERTSFDTLDDPLLGVKFILSLSGMLTLL